MDTTTTRSLRGWVADVQALESHVQQALDQQQEMDPRSPEVAEAIAFLADTVARSVARVEQRLEGMPGEGDPGLAESVADVLGTAAGLVDRMRATTVARSIRDDRVALASIIVGYQMLLTTALAVGDSATAQMCEMALRDYSACVQRVEEVLALATMDDLQADADITVVNGGVAGAVRAAMERASQPA